jgi:hypothetical protein
VLYEGRDILSRLEAKKRKFASLWQDNVNTKKEFTHSKADEVELEASLRTAVKRPTQLISAQANRVQEDQAS